MPVVSNTSPILNLAIIQQLDLLRQQFGEVLVPPAVLAELKVDSNYPGTDLIRQTLQENWLRSVELTHVSVARALRRELDHGEAEAIALAIQLGWPTVLIDEHAGRVVAQAMGLTPTGLLGVLLRAKLSGQIASLERLLTALQNEAGFYITADLMLTILREAGER
jgi:predicted nucleic acid-binding protein